MRLLVVQCVSVCLFLLLMFDLWFLPVLLVFGVLMDPLIVVGYDGLCWWVRCSFGLF